ncbi:MAG: hypothetical protein BRD34_00115 [Bacteroidetes bacterium QH_6_64_77]|nr:MAG: hypothetical protein BRD34_00115 [Bacteroidetes bacterium QH_6_64_77]
MPQQRSTSSETAYADLHTHTHCSDGTLPPDALVRRAAERDVRVLSVTDHDTTAGLEAARAAAQTHDIRLVNGVELSVEVDNHSVHLLGYGFDPEHPAVAEYLSDFTRRRRERLDQMIDRLTENGVEVSSEAVDRHVGTSAAPGRPHLARALVEEEHVDSYEAAFEQYLEHTPASGCRALCSRRFASTAWTALSATSRVIPTTSSTTTKTSATRTTCW